MRCFLFNSFLNKSLVFCSSLTYTIVSTRFSMRRRTKPLSMFPVVPITNTRSLLVKMWKVRVREESVCSRFYFDARIYRAKEKEKNSTRYLSTIANANVTLLSDAMLTVRIKEKKVFYLLLLLMSIRHVTGTCVGQVSYGHVLSRSDHKKPNNHAKIF